MSQSYTYLELCTDLIRTSEQSSHIAKKSNSSQSRTEDTTGHRRVEHLGRNNVDTKGTKGRQSIGQATYGTCKIKVKS